MENKLKENEIKEALFRLNLIEEAIKAVATNLNRIIEDSIIENNLPDIPREERKPNEYAKWTKADEAYVLQLYQQRYSRKEIAEKMGRTAQSISARLRYIKYGYN